ncbi:DNA polymerase sliding clamp [Natronoarchaeum rubrum]|uniref:DNA polymerase sliding clamp n=1 Tax=Natronoarchaeum rubrum TaxID=755311 RepID=UPI002111B09A|nr:DNA polymerase sliding clamp [Natronoarchaeum rubrum]
MAFSAIIAGDTLAKALEPVSALVDECKIRLNDDGIGICAVDAANVGMVDMELDASAFESYEATGGVLGVNLERLEDVLSMAESGQVVHFELNEETRKLDIEIGGLEYTLALIDPDSIRQEPDIPDLDLSGTYVFEGDHLDRAVRAADLCSDHISVDGVADDKLVFSAQGDTDDVDVTVERDDLPSGQLGDECSSLFSLDYLSDMKGPIGSDTKVSLRVGDELPIKLRYSLADGGVEVVNMLAPRIQND